MIQSVKNYFLKKKLNKLEIKHKKLLKKAESAMTHHKTDGEEYSKQAHIIENRINKLKDKLC